MSTMSNREFIRRVYSRPSEPMAIIGPPGIGKMSGSASEKDRAAEELGLSSREVLANIPRMDPGDVESQLADIPRLKAPEVRPKTSVLRLEMKTNDITTHKGENE